MSLFRASTLVVAGLLYPFLVYSSTFEAEIQQVAQLVSKDKVD